MTSSRLLARLLTIAAGGVGCSSPRPTTTPEPTGVVPVSSVALTASSATASAPVVSAPQVASAAPEPTGQGKPGTRTTGPGEPEEASEPEDRSGRDAPAAGGTALCRDGLAGVPGSWCSHLIPGQPRGFFGKPHETCRATPAGKFACPAVTHLQSAGATVCTPKAGACAAKDSAQARSQIDARYKTDGCPVFRPSQEAVVTPNGAGKDECCYRGDFALCVGRPLWVAGAMRLAARRPGAWG